MKPALIVQVSALVTGILALAFGLGLACTPAESATWVSIEKTVLADIENGSALSVIEAAVVAIDPAAGAVAGLVDQIIVEAIQLLEDTGALPVEAGATTQAEAVKGQAMAKMAAVRAK